MLRQLTRKLQQWFGGGAHPAVQCDFGSAVKHQPHSDCFERGLALRRAGDRGAALECFREAVKFRHDDIAALLNQGEIQLEFGRHEDAADCFELALAFAPDCVDALLGLARLVRDSGDEKRALSYLQHAVRIAPRSAEPYFELGRTYKRGGDTKAALASYGRALELDPDHFGSCVNTGLIHLAQLGDARNARRFFEHAVTLQPDSVAAQANLGLALQELGQFETALAHYNHLIEMHPDIAEYRWNRGIALLSRGDFANGWKDYELRNARSGKSVARRFPFAEWDDTALSAREILIYAEQGIGDEIMFASCVPDVLRQARGVVIECDTRLAALFRRSFPGAHVHGAPRDGQRDWLKTFPELSVQVAGGSLPLFFRRDPSDFPQHDGYLTADARRRAHWQTRLAALGGGLKVGICWRGGTVKTRRELRSLAFADCLPLLQRNDCEFICLQNGNCSDEVAAAGSQGGRLHWWPEAVRDIDELAALVSALDLVVAVPSTIVHVSGALGRMVWVMLSASPEWRYLWRGERMPWYPAARLFRQGADRAWPPVIEQIGQQLTAAVRS